MTIPRFMQVPVDIKLDDPKLMPVRAHASDAGADLFSKDSIEIYPGEMKLVDTGISVKIPLGHAGLVFNRSSQGKIKVQIANGTGVIDSDYRGNIKVLLANNGDDPYKIEAANTRIAQLVIVPVVLAQFRVFDDSIIGRWDDTVRSTGGFGSTGV